MTPKHSPGTIKYKIVLSTDLSYFNHDADEPIRQRQSHYLGGIYRWIIEAILGGWGTGGYRGGNK